MKYIYFLNKRQEQQLQNRKILSIILIVIGVVLLLCGTYIALISTWIQWSYIPPYIPDTPIPFETKEWKAERENSQWEGCSRMAKDLIHKNILINKTHLELVEILGKPEYDSYYIDTQPNEMSYLIREDHYGLGAVDPDRLDYLVITLDHTGRAEKVEITIYDRHSQK